MEYRQVQDFDKYLKKARGQKRKVLQASINEAFTFKNSRNRQDIQVNNHNRARIQTGATSTTESSFSEKATHTKKLEERKNTELTAKPKESNLSKRKPIVSRTELKPVKNEVQVTSVDTSESSNPGESPECLASAAGKGSSSAERPTLALINSGMRATDAIKVANALVEHITGLRCASPELKHGDRENIYGYVLKFCEVCGEKPDEELKKLVIKRVGSYLTAIYYLLLDFEEEKSDLHLKCIQTVCQLINVIKQKTLSYVN